MTIRATSGWSSGCCASCTPNRRRGWMRRTTGCPARRRGRSADLQWPTASACEPAMKQHLPIWTHEWLGVALPLLRITLIVLAAWLLRTLAVRLIRRITARYPDLPAEVALSARKLATFLISAAALLLVLETMGVSGAVLWTA